MMGGGNWRGICLRGLRIRVGVAVGWGSHMGGCSRVRRPPLTVTTRFSRRRLGSALHVEIYGKNRGVSVWASHISRSEKRLDGTRGPGRPAGAALNRAHRCYCVFSFDCESPNRPFFGVPGLVAMPEPATMTAHEPSTTG